MRIIDRISLICGKFKRYFVSTFFADGQNLPKFIFFENPETRTVKQIFKMGPKITAESFPTCRCDRFVKILEWYIIQLHVNVNETVEKNRFS